MAPFVAVMLTAARGRQAASEGCQLGRVALRRARGMGADMVDLGSLDARLDQGSAGGPRAPTPLARAG
jgi:hypothetical protein